MGRVGRFFAAWGLDVLVVAAAVATAAGTVLRDDADRPEGLALGFEVAAITVVLLALCARRWFPFVAPMVVWIGCAGLSFLDHQLISTQAGVFLCGLGAAVLFGSLRNGLQARVGLVVVLVGAAVIVYHDPDAHDRQTCSSPPCCSRSPGSRASHCASGRHVARPRRSGRCGPSGSESRRRGWRWPRSGHGWRASSTTSSPMR